MDIQQILDDLERSRWEFFPREALEAAIECREEITPHLLDILRAAGESFEDIKEDYDYMANVACAMYLLA